MQESWAISEKQTEFFFAELGRCVYVFQMIETILKTLMPHMVAPGMEEQTTPKEFRGLQAVFDSKETLGILIGEWQKRTVAEKPEIVEKQFRQLVTYRNEVVHLFLGNGFASCSSKEQFEESLEFLRVRRMYAAPYLKIFQELSLAILSEFSKPLNNLH